MQNEYICEGGNCKKMSSLPFQLGSKRKEFLLYHRHHPFSLSPFSERAIEKAEVVYPVYMADGEFMCTKSHNSFKLPCNIWWDCFILHIWLNKHGETLHNYISQQSYATYPIYVSLSLPVFYITNLRFSLYSKAKQYPKWHLNRVKYPALIFFYLLLIYFGQFKK